MIRGPFLRELLHGVVAAVAVDDEDAAEAAVRHAVEDVADDAEMRLDAQRDRARELAEVGRHAVRHDGKDRDAERFGRVDGDALGQDAVDREPQMAVLLGAAERAASARSSLCRYSSTCIQFMSLMRTLTIAPVAGYRATYASPASGGRTRS